MALYAPSIRGAGRLDAVGDIAQRHGYRRKRPHHWQFCERGQRCSKGHYSEVELLTRTLLEPTRTRGAEQIDRPPFKPSAAKRFYSNLLGLTRSHSSQSSEADSTLAELT